LNNDNNDNVDDIVVIDDEEYEDDELRVELPDRFWAKTTPHVLHDTISSDHFVNEQIVENIINPITQVNDDLYLNPNGINDNPNQDIEMNITNRNESSENLRNSDNILIGHNDSDNLASTDNLLSNDQLRSDAH